VLSRQGLPRQPRDADSRAAIRRGGYVLQDTESPKVILIATGSEVGLAVNTADELNAAGILVRVVSMPCRELFEAQDSAYRESVLPAAISARVAIEAGSPNGWHGIVGPGGAVIGMTSYGESAPASELFEKYGFTVQNVSAVIRELINDN
jgi:transketolase